MTIVYPQFPTPVTSVYLQLAPLYAADAAGSVSPAGLGAVDQLGRRQVVCAYTLDGAQHLLPAFLIGSSVQSVEQGVASLKHGRELGIQQQ